MPPAYIYQTGDTMPKPKLPETPEAFSLFGEPLNQQPPRPEVVEKQRVLYDEALKKWEQMPEDADSIIWLGRRTAYLGQDTRGCLNLQPRDRSPPR